jgi:Uma2 family endonuclease
MVVQPRLYTVDEFETFIALPQNVDRRFELINGEIVETMPTEEHSLVAGNFYAALREFVRPRNLGRVAFEVRFRMPEDQHNARLPDVSFTSTERLLPVVKKGAVPFMPDLAVEIKSPDDSIKTLREKAAYYLSNGTQLVWIADPDKRIVIVLTLDDEDILLEKDTLTGGDVLEGFSIPVAVLFDL